MASTGHSPAMLRLYRGTASRLATVAAAGLLLLLLGGLLGRILSAPLRRDEHMFFSMAMLARDGDLYRDFGFNHLPNMPLMLNALIGESADPFLAGRLLVFMAWVVTAVLLGLAAYRETRSRLVAWIAVVLLVTSPLLVNQTGTLISNNFLPIPFALAGTLAFFHALERSPTDRLMLVAAGFCLSVAAGLKANYVFLIPPFAVASLLLPGATAPLRRLLETSLPLLLGGVIGALPTLYFLARDPVEFLAHVVGYHRGPHLSFAADSADHQVQSVPERLNLAFSLWGSGGTWLILFIVGVLLLWRLQGGWRPDWRTILVGSLVVLGMLISLVPTPAFPQYYSPPVIFLILLLVLMLADLPQMLWARAGAMLAVLVGLVLLTDMPRVLLGLPSLARHQDWGAGDVGRTGREIAAKAGAGRIATLAPSYVLAGHRSVYPELAAGPFLYRVANLIPEDQRRYYRLVSPETLEQLLLADRPAAILLSGDAELDKAFLDFAMRHGYRESELAAPETRYGTMRLFLAPGR